MKSIYSLIVLLIFDEAASSSRFSSTLLQVEYRSDTSAEDMKEKLVSGSFDVLGSVGSPRPEMVRPKNPSPETEKSPVDLMPDTTTLALDTFVCRYVSPVPQCYSPSQRQRVVLRARSIKPSVVRVAPCTRTVIDVCFPFEKFCEV